MLGQTRIGRYDVVATLAPAARGAVYKAIDPETGRVVAIRTVDLGLSKAERAGFAGRFYCEANAARLSHANIVTIRDVGETDDIAYVAMDYVEGESLREQLDSGAVLPIEMTTHIAVGVANALNYAHANHVVHGDIRPENILITPDRDVKILNFGIAPIPAGSPTQPATILGIPGSPHYMAPEQLAGGNTDGRTDIFALGVVLYEMLTGVTPFSGDDPGAITDRVLKEVPVPPSALNARLPPVFDRIIGRALAKRPRDRYQTALEFARDLQNPDAYRAAVSNPTAIAVRTIGARAGQQDAPIAVPASAQGAENKEIAASPPGKRQQRRKPLLLAIPVLLIAAFVIYSQGDRPQRDELAAAIPKPAISAPPTDSGSPAVPAPAAESAAQAVSMPPTASAKPKITARPKASAKSGVSAKAFDVPESASVPPPVSATQANATMSLAISPWGEVYVDGKSVGVSPPLTTLQLEAGTYLVEIRNQASEPYRDTVNLEPDKSLKIKHKFR